MTNLVVLPLLFVMYLVDDFTIAIICDFFTYFIGETFISINFAMLMNTSSSRVAGLRKLYSESALFLASTFIGGSVATFILGLLSEDLELLRYGLLIINVIGYGVGGVLYGVMVKYYPKDYRDNQQAPLESAM